MKSDEQNGLSQVFVDAERSRNTNKNKRSYTKRHSQEQRRGNDVGVRFKWKVRHEWQDTPEKGRVDGLPDTVVVIRGAAGETGRRNPAADLRCRTDETCSPRKMALFAETDQRTLDLRKNTPTRTQQLFGFPNNFRKTQQQYPLVNGRFLIDENCTWLFLRSHWQSRLTFSFK